MRKPHDAFSISIADWTATGHANTGFGLYRQLEAAMRANGGKLPDVPDVVPLVVPAITNLTFAIELFMKVHAFQFANAYPNGHDIRELSKQFSESQLVNLREIYRSFMGAPEFVDGFVLDFSGNIKGNPGIPATPTSKAETYDDAVAEIGSSYVKWRYVYEGFGVEAFRERISFPTLWILIQTLKGAIRTNTGKVTIRSE